MIWSIEETNESKNLNFGSVVGGVGNQIGKAGVFVKNKTMNGKNVSELVEKASKLEEEKE